MNYSFKSKLKLHVSSSVLLLAFTVLALVAANIERFGIKTGYQNLWTQEVALSVGPLNFFSHGGHPITLGQLVNDFFMAIFFLSVGLEIKREIKVGELSSMDKALLPIIGACGGMLVPVLVFCLTCPADVAMQRGMAIPMATDIAFSLGILSLFKTRVPMSLKMFLAALAVADDLGGIIVIAIFYSSEISLLYLGFFGSMRGNTLLGKCYQRALQSVLYICRRSALVCYAQLGNTRHTVRCYCSLLCPGHPQEWHRILSRANPKQCE